MKLSINIGDKFGKLTVISELPKLRIPSGQTNRVFLCKCECGYEKTIRLVHLYRGRTVSCGCIRSGGIRIFNDDERRLRKVYRQMCKRVSGDYFESHLYYKKGITICDEWKGNINLFTEWAIKNGYKQGLVIDRKDNSKGYSPDNCRWVTQKENCVNKDNTMFVVYNGVKTPLINVLEEKGLLVNIAAIRSRVNRGWPHQKAIDTPIRKGNYKRRTRTH